MTSCPHRSPAGACSTAIVANTEMLAPKPIQQTGLNCQVVAGQDHSARTPQRTTMPTWSTFEAASALSSSAAAPARPMLPAEPTTDRLGVNGEDELLNRVMLTRKSRTPLSWPSSRLADTGNVALVAHVILARYRHGQEDPEPTPL